MFISTLLASERDKPHQVNPESIQVWN